MASGLAAAIFVLPVEDILKYHFDFVAIEKLVLDVETDTGISDVALL